MLTSSKIKKKPQNPQHNLASKKSNRKGKWTQQI